ncbi:MAG: NAD-dependent epimerase/dehydratase family protein [Candidatus Eisenbacteria bacterium]|uniref:NAD-dependent epimerase/dehydratase family protein n=1 Tax=Eiseniibacteriota bacterium TaxID=2212470 RepID=A0A538SMK6_UNCEI|nr:MAG: NAD-dependent epimerase/dehydratase family protein [Candidatus Eisenbacteria bacterium]
MRSPYRPRRILIAGATGTIGSAILPSLAGFGVPMRVLLHHRDLAVPLAGPPSLDDPGPRPTIEVARGDLSRPESIRGIAEGCDVLVHAAARTGFAGLARDAQRRVNVEGTQALLREAQSAGVRIFVLIGYTGTVQERDDTSRPVNEETLPEGRYESDYVRLKYETEAMVLESNRSGGMTTMVVSPGVLAQPGASTILGGFVELFVSGELPFRVLNEVWLATSDGADVGRGVASAIALGNGGRRYFLTGDCRRLQEIYGLLSEISGVPEPRRKLPDLLLEELGLLTPVLPRGSFLRRLVLPRELVLHMKRLAPVENARTRAELGLKPTPLRSTLTAMIGTEGDLARRRASI